MIVAVCFRALAVFTELSLNFKVNVTYLPSVAIPAMGGGYLILILCSVVLRNVHTREKMVPTVNVHIAIIISTYHYTKRYWNKNILTNYNK